MHSFTSLTVIPAAIHLAVVNNRVTPRRERMNLPAAKVIQASREELRFMHDTLNSYCATAIGFFLYGCWLNNSGCRFRHRQFCSAWGR